VVGGFIFYYVDLDFTRINLLLGSDMLIEEGFRNAYTVGGRRYET
jgi:hypothetical protein